MRLYGLLGCDWDGWEEGKGNGEDDSARERGEETVGVVELEAEADVGVGMGGY